MKVARPQISSVAYVKTADKHQQSCVDVIVVGGGIAGLWILSSLRMAGYDAILVEKKSLGGGQTLASQGIIHGGTKYALLGNVTGSSEAARGLPQRWIEHLSGHRLPDLSGVCRNSEHQWMWDAGDIPSKLSSFLAGKLMSGRVKPVKGQSLPAWLKARTVYQLHEPVLDVLSLVKCLAEPNRSRVFGAEAIRSEVRRHRMLLEVRTHSEKHYLATRALVWAAGEGNEGVQAYAMQRRALQMIMVKGDLPELWGHVIEAAVNPRLTITSHKCSTGEVVWYIGGQLAEDGVRRPPAEQIAVTRQELKKTFPNIKSNSLGWATLHINRAEGIQINGKRPDNPIIRQHGRQITVWPTKLAFAPVVADEVSGLVESMQISRSEDSGAFIQLAQADMGGYPWDQTFWQHG